METRQRLQLLLEVEAETRQRLQEEENRQEEEKARLQEKKARLQKEWDRLQRARADLEAETRPTRWGGETGGGHLDLRAPHPHGQHHGPRPDQGPKPDQGYYVAQRPPRSRSRSPVREERRRRRDDSRPSSNSTSSTSSTSRDPEVPHCRTAILLPCSSRGSQLWSWPAASTPWPTTSIPRPGPAPAPRMPSGCPQFFIVILILSYF